ncbi:MAG TPA: hypothetical protein GX400_09165 [Chloroflexi bacterium]|nr:hypothetical protein [Chloroflexota bacterium]
MTFAEVERRYWELKQQFDAGDLGEAEFDDALRALMIQDDLGRWWAKARDSGQWHYYDAVMERWVSAPPPTAPPPTAPPVMPPVMPTEHSAAPQSREQGEIAAQSAQPAQWRATSQPELSTALKVIFYFVSFLVPIAGIVLFFVYRSKPAPEDRAAARLFLFLGIIAFVLVCVCPFVFSMLVALAGV